MRYAAGRGIGLLSALLLAAFLSLRLTFSHAQPLLVPDNTPRGLTCPDKACCAA